MVHNRNINIHIIISTIINFTLFIVEMKIILKIAQNNILLIIGFHDYFKFILDLISHMFF